MSNLGHEGTRIRCDLGSVGFRLWRWFGYCRTGHNHGSANHDYDSSYYDGGTDNDHGSANHDYSHGCSNCHSHTRTDCRSYISSFVYSDISSHAYAHGCSNRHANPPTNRHSGSNASTNTYAAPYSSTSTYANHGERVRCRSECSRECGVFFGVLVVFS